MKKKLSFFILLLVVFFTPKIQFATIVTSNGTGGGSWDLSSTWVSGVPVCGDTITILDGDVVTVDTQLDFSSCESPMFLTISGTLEFPSNGPKLRFPCGSGIILADGGLITATASGGAGNANFIEICNSVVWKKADGDLNGPITLGTPLPIELISFEANVNEEKVELKWITASEINNDYFTIERSVDAKTWEPVLTTNGAGNSNQILEYFEIDYQPLNGISYYRLKQTDFNGKFSYSNIVPVKFSTNSTTSGINLFPSPIAVGETLHIEFKNIFESELLVVLRDIKGSEYYSKVIINIEDGKLIGVPIDTNIPSGVYLITATSENQMYSQKLIIK